MKNAIFILIFSISIFTVAQTENVAEKNTLEKAKHSEKFDDFINDFFLDKSFQLSRIEFPIDDCQNVGQYSIACDTIAEEDWEFILIDDKSKYKISDVGFPKGSEFNPDGFEQISFYKKSLLDNTCIEYYFYKRKTIWKLYQIVQCSE